jgi:hypothetical protein
MATTNTRGKRSTSRNGSRASSAGKGSASKRSPRSSSTNSRSKKRSTSSSQSKSNVEAIKHTAVEQTKSAAATIADTAGKAKTPLIAGGTAVLGVAAGAAINSRLSSGKSRNPIKRMRGASMPKLDLDTVKLAADRVSAYGQQASDIAAAVEKTRRKNG